MLQFMKKEFNTQVGPDARTLKDFDTLADWQMAIHKSARPVAFIPFIDLEKIVPPPVVPGEIHLMGLDLREARVDRIAEIYAITIVEMEAAKAAEKIMAALSPDTIRAAEELPAREAVVDEDGTGRALYYGRIALRAAG